MFKNLTALENEMRHILKAITKSDDVSSLFKSLNIVQANALHECYALSYLENTAEYVDANGYFHFSSLGNTYVNKQGQQFMRDTSKLHRIKNAVFDILKGTVGFIIGVITALATELIIWIATHPEAIPILLADALRRI